MADAPTSNPFQTEEAWEVSTDTMLSEGDHFCNVQEIDGTQTSSGGYPQIVVKVGNAEGSIRDWMVVIPSSVGRVLQFTEALGLDKPTDDEVDMVDSGYRLSQDYLNQALGKPVGVLVRAEPDRMDPTKTRDRVKGYVTPDQVDAPPIGDHTFKQDKQKDDLPF